MAGGLTLKWGVAAAWEAAVEVTAAAFDVDPDGLRAESRGRGPRPAAELWAPKKMAVHVAVILADCGYAALGAHLGLHRDTVASHCASIRELAATDDRFEALSETLVAAGSFRLDALDQPAMPRRHRRKDVAPLANHAAMLAALQTYMQRVAGDLVPILSDEAPLHPTNSSDKKKSSRGIATDA